MLAIRLILILLIFSFSVNITLASEVSQFVFTTNPQIIKPNEISEILTIQAQDSGGNSVKIPQTGCLKLETTSKTGEFSSNSTNWEPVNQLTMNKGWANRNFYYKDSTADSYTLTVKAALTPCSAWTESQWTVQQDIIVSDSTTLVESETPEPTPGVGSASWPVEPQIYANAGGDKIVIVGVETKFSGKAFGLQKEPLDSARYLWSFGDGATAEGQSVLHVYQYPGEYIVVLNVNSGKYTASDNLLVKVVSNQLKISEANENFIKLQNDSQENINISNWFLKFGKGFFKIPETTIIKSGASLNITSTVSSLLPKKGDKVELLYPNASVAYTYNNNQKTITNNQTNSNNQTPSLSPVVVATTENVEHSVSDMSEESNNPENQTASIVSVNQEENSMGLMEWAMIVLGIGLVSGIGFVFIRRKGPV